MLCRAALEAAFEAKAIGWGSPLECKTGITGWQQKLLPTAVAGQVSSEYNTLFYLYYLNISGRD